MQIVPGQLETFNDFVVFSPPTMGLSAIRTVSKLESCLPQIAGVNSSSPRKIVASMAGKRFKHYVFAGWSKKICGWRLFRRIVGYVSAHIS
jgi:hypothetical protein